MLRDKTIGENLRAHHETIMVTGSTPPDVVWFAARFSNGPSMSGHWTNRLLTDSSADPVTTHQGVDTILAARSGPAHADAIVAAIDTRGVTMQHLRRVLAFGCRICLLCLLLEAEAYAYIDPGTGSYILQILLAVVVGALFAIKQWWINIKGYFKKLFASDKTE